MTPEQVDAIARWGLENHCDRDECGAADCTFARNVETLCDEWNEQQATIATLRSEVTQLQAEVAMLVQGITVAMR